MSLDKMSTEDLMALREGNFEAMSTEGLKMYRNMSEPQTSLLDDAKDIGIATGAALADAATKNVGSLVTGAAGAYGANQIRKGLLGMGSKAAPAGAPAAATPAGAPAGGLPSNAGAGTPQQQAASKLATQNLRSQQLHGTLPANQASHIGGSKAWTVNPSGIITPDDAMQRAPQTSASAPQQGRLAQAAGKLKGAGQTVVNAAGQAVGKIPMGQAAKLLAKGAARFVPGLGLVLVGYDAGKALYNAHERGKLNTRDEMDGQGAISAANGGIAHMSDGGNPNKPKTFFGIPTLSGAIQAGVNLAQGRDIGGFDPKATLSPEHTKMRDQWLDSRVASEHGDAARRYKKAWAAKELKEARLRDSGKGHEAAHHHNTWSHPDSWAGYGGNYRESYDPMGIRNLNKPGVTDPDRTPWIAPDLRPQVSKWRGEWRPEMGNVYRRAMGGSMNDSVGMMKAQIGNYKAGGRIL